MKGDKMVYPLFGNRILTVTESKEKNALPYINKRFEYFIPIEAVKVEDVLAVIQYIRVNPTRACSPEEVYGIVEQIKHLLTEAVQNMDHYNIHLNKRGIDNDTEGS